MKRDILVLLVVLMVAEISAVPIKSNIASREISTITSASMPTAADYIQDGLIAMWDGIENAGYGIHDDSATKWIDCMSGLEFTPYGTLGDTVTFNSNCVTLSGGNSYLRRGSQEVKPIIQGNGSEAYFTVELCNKPISDIRTKNFASYCGIGTLIGSYGYGVRWYVAENWAVRYLYVKNTPYTFGSQLTSEQPWTMTIVSDGNMTKWYLNGSLVRSGAHGSTTGWFDNWFLGGGSSSGNYWQGDIFSHRFYNRALSDAEIEANYNIDKARFGL